MQSPEILLKDLNYALRELYGAAQMVPDERLKADMPVLMRKLLLAEVLGDTAIIAIGGAQGAGKTTLLRSLYLVDGVPFEWLDPNEGRGEMLPVLVLEDAACQVPQGFVRCIKLAGERYETVEEQVDVAAFRKAVCAPDLSVLLPVLKVPQKYFNRPNQAWLLLPGYEPQKRENKTWQDLMRQALVGATGCVVVTDETRLAGSEQASIVNDLLFQELTGADVLVVISKTELIRDQPARLQELQASAARVFGVPAARAGRWIICTGSDDKHYIDAWLPRMQKAIDGLARARAGNRKLQLHRLHTVLSLDLAMVLGLIQTKATLMFQQREARDGGPPAFLENCLEAFDDAAGELRESYQEEVIHLLDERFGGAWKALQQDLQDEHEGLINKLRDLLKTATESRRFIERHVENAWGSPAELMRDYAGKLEKLTSRKLGAGVAIASASDVAHAATPTQKTADSGPAKPSNAYQRPSDEDAQNLRFVLAGSIDPASKQASATSTLESSIKLLPVLALEWVRLGALMPGVVGVNPDMTLTSPAERSDVVRQAVQLFGDGVQLGQTLTRSLALILAVDVAGDGDIDLVPILTNVFAGTNATTTATGASVAIGGFSAALAGVVAVSYLVHSAICATREHDERARVAAYAMLMSVKDHHQMHFMRHFKQLMDQLRARLRDSLRQRYRLNEILLEKDRLAVALGNVRSLQRDLLDHIARSGQTLALFDGDETA